MIKIIDYGMANLASVKKAFEAVGAEALITDRPEDIKGCSHVVLPGVGAFGDAMINIRKLGFDKAIYESIESGAYFLGICVGLQVLLTVGEEKGIHKGLDIFKGRVRIFEQGLVPQIGWNQAHFRREDPLLKGIPDHSYFYFVHSYYVEPEEKDTVLAQTDYYIDYASIMNRDRIYGIQFHPEKSQKNGLGILKNFSEMKG